MDDWIKDAKIVDEKHKLGVKSNETNKITE